MKLRKVVWLKEVKEFQEVEEHVTEPEKVRELSQMLFKGSDI